MLPSLLSHCCTVDNNWIIEFIVIMFNFSYDTYFDFMDKVTIGEYYNEANNSEIQLMWNKHILEPLQVRT